MRQLYRILYCSRTAIDPADAVAAIRHILAKSRENNRRDDVTGGLFFSHRCFAQVLEGPQDAVAAAFERIQCDERHCEVTVLEAGVIESRAFPEWSMAFAGIASDSNIGNAIVSAAFSGQTTAGDRVLDLLRGVVVREDDWLIERAA